MLLRHCATPVEINGPRAKSYTFSNMYLLKILSCFTPKTLSRGVISHSKIVTTDFVVASFWSFETRFLLRHQTHQMRDPAQG